MPQASTGPPDAGSARLKLLHDRLDDAGDQPRLEVAERAVDRPHPRAGDASSYTSTWIRDSVSTGTG
jgi:hypothetical protein